MPVRSLAKARGRRSYRANDRVPCAGHRRYNGSRRTFRRWPGRWPSDGMALNSSMIYRRTDRGVREVYEKSHQFTQSERLILILLDGRLNVAGLKTRLPSLNDERIERAMRKLQDAGLVEPMGSGDLTRGNTPIDGRLEPEAVAQFLEQSDLDPVTIFGDSDEAVATELVRARVEQAAAQVAREAAAQARATSA